LGCNEQALVARKSIQLRYRLFRLADQIKRF
jgi:hypothetical protein